MHQVDKGAGGGDRGVSRDLKTPALSIEVRVFKQVKTVVRQDVRTLVCYVDGNGRQQGFSKFRSMYVVIR